MLVGTAAALVHLTVVSAIVPLGPAPLAANIVGFLLAFMVSFAGHWRLTFRDSGARLAVALKRFFAVSVLSFALNESLYAALLRWSPLDYRWALALVLVIVAALTFALSKRWAFN